MQIIKADWVTHDGQPIYSIDIQRGDKRFVTGGQSSSGSGLVVIWNLASVLDKCIEDDKTVAKVLCRLENHTACVNCVRWSENGKFLASAGSDQTIMIWQYAGLNKSNRENWKCTQVLRGHQGDVLHLAWSPGDRLLASSSVDNTVIVWKSDKFLSRVATLEGHSGFVKGVAWDPVGIYLASQADDKTLKIWSASTWKCVMTLKKPFRESAASSTHFLRLDWSPDGAALTAVHATSSGGPVAKMVARNTWAYDNELVGHRKAISCSRFSSTMYSKDMAGDHNPSAEQNKLFTLCAAGSKDRSLSVWSTAFSRPLVVVRNLFAGNVMDLSWSRTSFLYLAACSHDGTVAFLEFTKAELGSPLDYTEKQEYLSKTYGTAKRPVERGGSLGDEEDSLDAIIDDPKLYLATCQKVESIDKPALSQNPPSAVQPASKVVEQDKQVESRNKDGRRIIRPIFLGASVVEEDPALQTTSAAATQAPIPASHSSALPMVTDGNCLTIAGDNRLATSGDIPVAIPCSSTTSPTQPLVPLNDLHLQRTDSSDISFDKKIESENVGESVKLANKSIDQKKRKRSKLLSDDDVTEAEEVEDSAHHSNNRTSLSASNQQMNRTQCSSIERKISIIEPPLKKSISCLPYSARSTSTLLTSHFVCVNDSKSRTTLVSFVQNNLTIWRTLVGHPCRLISATEKFVVICGDCSLLVVLSSKTGRFETPNLCIDSPACILQCSRDKFLIVSKNGSLYIWNASDHAELMIKQSIHDIGVIAPTNLAYANLSQSGDPIVSLSCGSSYVYCTEYNSWLVFSDQSDLIGHVSNLKSPPNGRAGNSAIEIYKPDSTFGKNIDFLPKFDNVSSAETSAMASLVFAEQRMQLYNALHCQRDFGYWLIEYARECVRQTHVLKIKSLCQELLDQILLSGSKDKSKRNHSRLLLQTVLNLVSKNCKLQRIFREFKDQLDATTLISGTVVDDIL